MAKNYKDFDAFFAEKKKTKVNKTIMLYGKEWILPDSMPLAFILEIQALNKAGVKTSRGRKTNANVISIFRQRKR